MDAYLDVDRWMHIMYNIFISEIFIPIRCGLLTLDLCSSFFQFAMGLKTVPIQPDPSFFFCQDHVTYPFTGIPANSSKVSFSPSLP